MGVVPLLNLPKLRLRVILPALLSEEKMEPRARDALQEPGGTGGGKRPRPGPLGGPCFQSQGKGSPPFNVLLGSQRLARNWSAPRHACPAWIPNRCSQHLTRRFFLSPSTHVSHTVKINCRRTFWFRYLFSHRPSLWG